MTDDHADDDPLATLRALLNQTPGQRTWQAAWALLRAWPDAATLPVALDYADAHLDRWPEGLRVARLDLPPDNHQGAAWTLLRTLDLSRSRHWYGYNARAHLTHDHLRTLTSSPYLDRIHTLDLTAAGLRGATVAAILDAGTFASLHHLRMGHNPTPPDDALRLTQAPALAYLRTLNMTGVGLTNHGAYNFAQARHFHRLTHLNLSRNHLGNQGLYDLFTHAHLPALTHLDLSHNTLTHNAIDALLSRADAFPRLHHLNLRACTLDDEALEILAEDPFCARLRTVDLAHNRFGRVGLDALIASPHMGNLTHLTLTQVTTLQRTIERLRAHPNFPSLDDVELIPRDPNRRGG